MKDDRQPTIEEMRRVARYLSEVMGLHSAAGKLYAKATLLEVEVELLMEMEDDEQRTR